MFRSPPVELGQLIAVYRPWHPVGWLVLAVLPVPFAIWAALADPGPLIGLAILVGFGVPWAYGLSEWFLLQHRVHEHGIVFRTMLPGTYAYVVPFHTVNGDAVVVRERRRVARGELEIARGSERQNPLLQQTLVFRGLDPRIARDLAKGKLAWSEAGASRIEIAGDSAHTSARTVGWQISVRDAERARARLTDVIRDSQRTYPYDEPVRPPQ